jgi:hypothetical protein
MDVAARRPFAVQTAASIAREANTAFAFGM